MNYDVIYRAKDGKQDAIRLAASDRASLFAELENRGITAIRVKEATGKPLARNHRGRGISGKAKWPWAFAVLAILAVASVAALLLLRREEMPEAAEVVADRGIQEARPSAASAPVEKEEPAAPATQAEVNAPVFMKRPGALQLPNGKVITFKPPAPGEEKTVWVQGRKYTVDSEGNFRDDSPVKTFDNRFENTMEAMSAVGGGVLPAAALSIPKDDIAKYLASPIVINEDDPEDVVEKKIATAEMKELLKDYMRDGGTWENFVMELNHIRRSEHMLQSQAIAEIARMLRDGDEEGAQIYREKADEFMKSKGYRGLKVPKAWGLGEPQD